MEEKEKSIWELQQKVKGTGLVRKTEGKQRKTPTGSLIFEDPKPIYKKTQIKLNRLARDNNRSAVFTVYGEM